MLIEDLAGFENGGAFNQKGVRHPYFNPEFGVLEFDFWYADNEIHSLELRFSVPASEWNEFQGQPFFRELIARLESFRPEIPDTASDTREPECTEETAQCDGNTSSRAFQESFWGKARRWFQKLRCR